MRKKTFLSCALSGIFLFISLTIFAQNKTVTGKVVDKDGAAVAGASVVVKGSNLGTNTDVNGGFSINVPSSAKTLVISYVGLAPQDVTIGSAPLSVTMEEATSNDLNEVVVVGYGSVRKRDLTGSVASVGAKDFNTGQINSPEQLLQG
jgi:iron complex outermembrane receptor protein